MMFASVLSGLLLLNNSSEEQEVKTEMLSKLVEDIVIVREFINDYLSKTNEKVQLYLNEDI